MGVPGLFAFLRRRYPQICSPSEKRKGGSSSDQQPVDNLYIDMNHIIHSCTHAHVAKDRPEISTTEMFAGMAAYLQQLLDLLEPRRTVMIAIDGVAPRAKMNQQRTRRFLSAYISGITDRIESEVRREMSAEAGGDLSIPEVERFDSNIITPGTDFMLQLADWLKEWAAGKVTSDVRFKHVTFIISDAFEPGEGEHKIMRYVRHLKLQPGYDPNMTHVVYGQDADLLLLSLLCHEPYFIVMRENMEAGTLQSKDGEEGTDEAEPMSAVQVALKRQQAEGPPQGFPVSMPEQAGTGVAAVAAASHGHLHMPFFEKVDIAVLRECIQWEFSELVGPPGPPGTYGSDESDTEADSAAAAAAGSTLNGSRSTSRASLAETRSTGTLLRADEPGSAAGVNSDSSSSDDLEGLLRLATSTPAGTTAATDGTNTASPAAAAAASGSGGAPPSSNSRVRRRGQRGLTFEALLDDLVVLSFLAGNDFLPNVPSIDIYDKPCGLDLLFTAYKTLLPKMGGHIAGGGSINRSRLVQLLVFLARDEEPAYKRRSEYRQRRAAQERDKQASATADFYSLFDGGLSMGELPPGVDLDKLDTLLSQLGPELAQELGLSDALAANRADRVDVKSLSPGQLCEELHNRVAARVKEWLMGGDPWAQDPVGMHLPGYRERYYEMRFPELYMQYEGDVDRVASRVAYEYLEGINWVLRYYACGPATVDWRQQQQQQQQQQQGPGAETVGASWSWCYSYHYAPLMQDLSKVRLLQKGNSSSSKVQVSAGPISISRSLQDPVACTLEEWAPLGGPVRPLLQLMCVLPAKSVLAALPASLAHLIVLAEAMEEDQSDQQQRSCQQQQHLRLQQQQQQGGHMSKAARKQAHKARKAVTAARVEGLQGLDILAALGDDTDPTADDHGITNGLGGGAGSPTGSGEGSDEFAGDEDTAAVAAAVAEGGFSHLLSDDAELSMLRLAKELCGTFPNNVEQLVDLTGKRWLHTGVVRLPMAQPQHLAAVLQAVLSLQQQQQQQQPWQQLPWQQQQQQQQGPAPMGLTDSELSRNTFKPAAVVATAAAAAAVGAAQPAAPTLPPGFGSSSSTSSGSSTDSSSVWKLLTRTTAADASSSSGSASTPSQPAANVATAARRLGALGMLLSHSGGMHTLSNSTMQHLVPGQQQQQQQAFRAELDVAGLPVPQHDCCLVEGAEPPPLTVTSAVWRRTAAGFASAISYAEKVLGIRSNDSSSNGSNADSGRGRGRGGRSGAEARGRARGRGRDMTRQLYEHHHQQQEEQRQQQEERRQEAFNQQVAAMSAPRVVQAHAAPAVDPSAYYYSADDDYSSSSGSSMYTSSAARAYMNFGGYDNQYQPGGAPRGRGKIGVGNRGRVYRSNNR